MTQTSAYTCSMYREEMQLLALKRRLNDESMSAEERCELEAEIKALEIRMGLS
jgi:hypothetical protein